MDKMFNHFNLWFAKITRSYTNGVRKWIKKSRYVVVMMVCLFFGLFFLFKNKPTAFIPIEDEKRVYVTYELPEGSSTTRSVEMLLELQSRIRGLDAVHVVGGLAGLNILTFSNKSNTGTLFVLLKALG